MWYRPRGRVLGAVPDRELKRVVLVVIAESEVAQEMVASREIIDEIDELGSVAIWFCRNLNDEVCACRDVISILRRWSIPSPIRLVFPGTGTPKKPIIDGPEESVEPLIPEVRSVAEVGLPPWSWWSSEDFVNGWLWSNREPERIPRAAFS